MQLGTASHASDEALEQYSMGSLNAMELKDFEEHLLTCESCQDQLAFTDTYLKSMRRAALKVRRQDGAAVTAEARPHGRKWLGGLLELSNPAWVLGMGALVVLVAAGTWLPSMHRSVAQPAVVLLQSNRGAESPLNSSPPSAKPLTVMLDATDLPQLPQYRLVIVDTAGRAIFQSTAAPEHNRLRATIAKGLPGGIYYVRVYGQELLREYGLQARE